MKSKIFIILTLFAFSQIVNAQKGVISGQLVYQGDSVPIEKVPIVRYGTAFLFRSDESGHFKVKRIKPGLTELIVGDEASKIFKTKHRQGRW